LFWTNGIRLVISPLNIFGQQNIAQLAQMKIQGITITVERATPKNFQVYIRTFYVIDAFSRRLGHRGWKIVSWSPMSTRRDLDAAGWKVSETVEEAIFHVPFNYPRLA
jgi:hypothetical protein